MLKQRVFSGAILILISLYAFLGNSYYSMFTFIIGGSLMLIFGLQEYFTLIAKTGFRGFPKYTICTALLMFCGVGISVLAKNTSTIDFEVFLIICFISFGFIRTFKNPNHKDGLMNLLVSLGGLIYIGWTLVFIAKIYFFHGTDISGRYLAIFMIAVTKCADMGAYFVGTATSKRSGGNHKIAPKLSPKKSYEGLIGGIFASILCAMLLNHFMGEQIYMNGRAIFNTTSLIILGIFCALFGFVGDIAESVLKRATKTKDSGKIFPGMGGVLDVADSLILVAPMFYIFLQVVQ